MTPERLAWLCRASSSTLQGFLLNPAAVAGSQRTQKPNLITQGYVPHDWGSQGQSFNLGKPPVSCLSSGKFVTLRSLSKGQAERYSQDIATSGGSVSRVPNFLYPNHWEVPERTGCWALSQLHNQIVGTQSLGLPVSNTQSRASDASPTWTPHSNSVTLN